MDINVGRFVINYWSVVDIDVVHIVIEGNVIHAGSLIEMEYNVHVDRSMFLDHFNVGPRKYQNVMLHVIKCWDVDIYVLLNVIMGIVHRVLEYVVNRVNRMGYWCIICRVMLRIDPVVIHVVGYWNVAFIVVIEHVIMETV